MIKNPKISIIVPVYNPSNKIKILLDSLLNQTYQNFEILLMDDGSTDDSLTIMQKYEAKYPEKIIVHSRKNKGLSYTRNEGLRYATGEYLTFCDNDDEVEKDYLESFINILQKEDYDILVGGYKRMSYEGKTLFTRKLENQPIALYIQLACWGKLYKTSFIMENHFEFLNTKIADDFYFNILAYQKAEKIYIMDTTKYHWLYNQESLSNTKNKKLNYTDDLIFTLSTIDKKIKIAKDRELLEYFYLRTIVYYLLFSCKGASKKKISKSYDTFFQWFYSVQKVKGKNKYLGITKKYGEEVSVKWIMSLFLLLQKLGIIKFAIFVYSKI